MNESRDKEVVDRLIELTQMNQIPWNPVYPEGPDGPAGLDWMSQLTSPVSYVAEDMVHGFGVAALQLRDPANEEYEPAVYLHGRKLQVDGSTLSLLMDSVAQFFEEVQLGRAPNQQLQMERVAEELLGPLQEQIEMLRRDLDRSQLQLTKQMEISEKLSAAVLHAATPKTGPPLTPATLKQALGYLFDRNAEFEAHFTPERLGQVVQNVTADLINGKIVG